MPQSLDFGDKFVLICEEAEICKRLSSNDIKVRRKGVAALKHLLKNIDNRKVVDSTDFSRLWNGIFNFIWMSDKLLVQEEDVESISKLIHVLKKHEMLFVRGFFTSLTNQWNRISHFRTDKFLMMVRRFLRQILFLLKNSAWNSEKIDSFSLELYSAIQILPLGLVLHLNDIYIEEIAKVSEGNIPTHALTMLLKGYVECIVALKPNMNIVNHINSSIFSGLTRQLKIQIKQKAILAAEDEPEDNQTEDEVTDELPENRAFDPRPGNVDVFLPFIEFDEEEMVKFLVEYEKRPTVPSKAKNILSQIISMFKSLTKFRESINNPKRVMNEAYSNTNKRRKKHKSLGSLIKKSCKRLEMFEAESDEVADYKILKKLEKMNDSIQIPAVKKSEKKNSSKNKKLKKKSDRSEQLTWTVTENIETSTAVGSQHNSEWMVSECELKADNSIDVADNSQDMELVLSSPTVEKSCAVSPCKRRSVEIASNSTSSPIKPLVGEVSNDDSVEISSKRRKLSLEKEEPEITSSSPIRQALRSSPQNVLISPTKSSEATGCEVQIEAASENSMPSRCRTPSPKKSPKKANDKPLDNSPESKSSPACKIRSPLNFSAETKRENQDEVAIENNTLSSCTAANLEKSPQKIVESENEPVSICTSVSKCRTPSPKKSLKLCENENRNESSPSCRTRSRLMRKLDADTAIKTPEKRTRRSSGSLPDVVSVSEKKKTKLSTVEEDTVLVDPSPRTTAKKVSIKKKESKRQILTSDSPAWVTVPNDELATWLPKNEKDIDDDYRSDEDVDYDISGLFASPSQQNAQKRRRSTRPVVQEVKRSARLANKAAATKIGDDKKVAFTGSNSFQEVREYRSSLRSSPKNPYDASKTPVKGILKPFAVAGPINPFYFPNGQPKLLNLRKQRLQSFL